MRKFLSILATIVIWYFAISGIIYSLGVIFDSRLIVSKILAIVLLLISIYFIPIVYKRVIIQINKGVIAIFFIIFFSVINYLETPPELRGDDIPFYVTAEVLNIREVGSIDSPTIFQLKLGEEVQVISVSDDWFEIETTEGKRGFAFNEYLSTDNPLEDNTMKWLMYLVGGWFIYRFLFSSKSSRASGSTGRTVQSHTQPKNQYICEFCGVKSDSPRFTSSTGCRNKTGHAAFEGGIQDKYICKYCGTTDSSILFISSTGCLESPDKKHSPLRIGIQAEYTCKHCGTKDSNLRSLTFNSCLRSSTGRHQVFEG